MTPLDRMLKEAAKLQRAADEHGWEIDVTESKIIAGEHKIYVQAVRGQEQINIWWINGKLIEAPKYDLAGRETKLRNASACVQQMADKPDFRKVARRMKVATRNGDDSIQIDITPRPETLPWAGIEDLTDAIILRQCYNKKLMWVNSLTQDVEIDHVLRSLDPKNFKGNYNKKIYHISRSSSGRIIINFLGSYGFRSVAIDTLLRVG